MNRCLLVLLSGFLFSTAIAQKAPTPEDWYQRGMELKTRALYPDAIVAFKRALALNKRFDSAYIQISESFVSSGHPDSGIVYLRKLSDYKPTVPGIWMSIANTYKNVISDPDSALVNYKRVLALDSTDKTAWCFTAWCYNAMKKYDEAIPYAVKALSIDNNYRPAYGELAFAFNQSKRYADGVEQFKKNLAVSVVDVAYYYSGLCYMMLNDTTNAMKQYDELKKINEKMAEGLKRRMEKYQKERQTNGSPAQPNNQEATQNNKG